MTVKDIFGTAASDVSEERILWHFENCLKETEDVGECALSELPKEWETLLWKNYTREDVIKKYKEDYEEAMTVYNASTRYPYDDFFVYLTAYFFLPVKNCLFAFLIFKKLKLLDCISYMNGISTTEYFQNVFFCDLINVCKNLYPTIFSISV